MEILLNGAVGAVGMAGVLAVIAVDQLARVRTEGTHELAALHAERRLVPQEVQS